MTEQLRRFHTLDNKVIVQRYVPSLRMWVDTKDPIEVVPPRRTKVEPGEFHSDLIDLADAVLRDLAAATSAVDELGILLEDGEAS
jgi:hypothetical protein